MMIRVIVDSNFTSLVAVATTARPHTNVVFSNFDINFRFCFEIIFHLN